MTDGIRKALRRGRARSAGAALLAALVACAVLTSPASAAKAPPGPPHARPFAVRALVVTMFRGETAPWLRHERLRRRIAVPSMEEPLRCDGYGLCVATVGEGKANAATSMSAILDDPRLDLTKAYVISAGTAGAPPTATATLGFAAWADWVVDYDLGHHVSSGTDPGIPHGYLRGDPVGTNVYRLNGRLVSEAYRLTRHLRLTDSATARAARAHYAGQAGRKPFVTRCDTVTGDDFWTGRDASETAAYVVDRWTGGKGTYCTTQQEDNATAAALARHHLLGRYLSLRTASDFDRPYPGESAREALTRYPGYTIAVSNAYTVASRVAHHLVRLGDRH